MKPKPVKLPNMAKAVMPVSGIVSIHIPPMPIPDAGPAPIPPQFVRQPDRLMIENIESARSLLNHLRKVRDSQAFKAEGANNFREWTMNFTPQRAGAYDLKVKATNRIGQSQPSEALWNPAGYMRNVVETVHVNAA